MFKLVSDSNGIMLKLVSLILTVQCLSLYVSRALPADQWGDEKYGGGGGREGVCLQVGSEVTALSPVLA